MRGCYQLGQLSERHEWVFALHPRGLRLRRCTRLSSWPGCWFFSTKASTKFVTKVRKASFWDKLCLRSDFWAWPRLTNSRLAGLWLWLAMGLVTELTPIPAPAQAPGSVIVAG